MPPDIYTPVRKIWGTSEVCFRDKQIEVVRIVVLPGGFCSRHLHRRKSNQFIVTKGELMLFRHFSGESASDGLPTMEAESLTACGRTTATVGAGIEHRFRCGRNVGGTGAVAYEIYAAIEGENIDFDDIERFDEGGRD